MSRLVRGVFVFLFNFWRYFVIINLLKSPQLFTKRYIFLLIQVIVSAALVFFVFKNIHLGDLSGAFKNAQIKYIIFALVISVPAWIIGIFKWRFLANTIMDESPPFRFFISYYLVGYFYALFVPGGQLLGEGIKAWRISNKSELKDQLYLSVFADKAIGFIALGCLVLISFLTQPILYGDRLSILSLAVSAAIVLVGIMIFFNRTLLEYMYKIPEYLAKFFPAFIAGHVGIFKNHLLEYHRRKKSTLISIGIGTAAQLIWVLAIYFIVLSFNFHVPFLFIAWTFLIMSVATFLPISYAGLGVREGTFVYFFSLIGVPRELALSVSLVLFSFQILVALTGGGFELKELWGRMK
ncbi:MAG: flippase-like domain-containing protein [Candidatus Yanofskybacteria bacterium]|nr:flippase-like domain-containing protein [Candidatus Yanofskybacteria bacterium]